jgi:hypothetical protein
MSEPDGDAWTWSTPEAVSPDDPIVHGNRWRRERDRYRALLEWAMERVAMVGCTCRWDEEGNPPEDCRCDQRPDWVRYREIKGLLDGEGA